MRFTAATVALFATLAVALPGGDVQTIYETEDVTITSCAPTVTDCPGKATSTPEGVEAVTTPPAVVPTAAPTPSSVPVEVPSSVPVEVPSAPAPEVPSVSVIPVTTCIPTVTYSTITYTPTSKPAKTSVPVIPTGGPAPSGSATPSTSAPGPIFTGAASSVSNSFAFAGAAAAAAFFLA